VGGEAQHFLLFLGVFLQFILFLQWWELVWHQLFIAMGLLGELRNKVLIFYYDLMPTKA
jgi:hypothetical protein